MKNVALCFFETPNKLNAKTIGHAKKYDLILAGSDFNTQALKAKGVNHVATAWQGVDTQLFKPSSSSERSSAAQAFEGKFVVFSGGKLEMRKVSHASLLFPCSFTRGLILGTRHCHRCVSEVCRQAQGCYFGHSLA